MSGRNRSDRPSRVERAYRALSLLVFNTLVVLVVLNLAAAGVLAFLNARRARSPGSLGYGMERLSRVHPGWSAADIETLLRESWSRKYVYAPFVQHREGPIRGRFVNVDPHGFRLSADQGRWPPAEDTRSVFVFGGSTTFGYGVADHETIPSRLQQALAESACGRAPRVYNFGRGNYYSEQERVLFEGLLSAGDVPDVAVFFDGLNEFKDTPKFTSRLDYLLSESDGQLALRAAKKLPAVQLLKALRDRQRSGGDDGPPASTGDADGELGGAVVRRWLRSKRLIEAAAGEFGVLAVFVWQPVPTYQYDLDYHLFAKESARGFARHGALKQGYRLMDANREAWPELEPSGNFLWLADMQRNRREPLHVDAAHYTAALSDEIARRIAGFMAVAAPCPDGGDR